MTDWTANQMPDQTGRTAIVTGANTGIGYETALELARHGADVIVASRSPERGQAAVERIRAEDIRGSVTFAELDLASLESVHAFADAFARDHQRLDLLINNAGVMMPAKRELTREGFELQFGTNHLGHFALTGLLLPLILATPGARIVSVSSMAHRGGSMDFNDLNSSDKRYDRMQTYGQSKLANLLFTFELDRKLRSMGTDARAVAAHPGWTSTDLQRHSGLFRFLNPVFSQKPPQGALPTLYAATAADVVGSDYLGPDGWGEMRGGPKKVGTSDAARNEADARQLWQVSERLTGVRFETPVQAAA